MLQEAHLDHRIQLNFDDKNGEEEGEEVLEEEDEGDEPAVAEGQPAGDAQARRDRGGRLLRYRSVLPWAASQLCGTDRLLGGGRRVRHPGHAAG